MTPPAPENQKQPSASPSPGVRDVIAEMRQAVFWADAEVAFLKIEKWADRLEALLRTLDRPQDVIRPTDEPPVCADHNVRCQFDWFCPKCMEEQEGDANGQTA